jgi:Beta-lactamase superfamily domain
MRNFSVKCFGTGDGAPCADRNHAAFLYRFNHATILVDCGEALDSSYKRAGFSYDLIDAIFISHLHSDHFGGLFMFLQGCWLEGRRKELPIYMPARGIKPLRAMLDAAFLFAEALPFRLSFKPIQPNKTIAVKQVRITPFRTSHLDQTRARFGRMYRSDFSSYCFLFESGNRRIGHSADLGNPADLGPLLREPLALLICELSHFEPGDICAYLRPRKIGEVIFVHVRSDLWKNLPHTRRVIKRMMGLPHRFATNGQEIAFS